VVDPHEAARDHEVLARVFGFHAETPAMWFAPSRMQEHGLMVEAGRYAVLHPGSSRPERIFEIDKWAAVARELVASGAVDRVVVSAGPGGSERIMAEALCGLIGPVAMSTGGRLRFAQLARLDQGGQGVPRVGFLGAAARGRGRRAGRGGLRPVGLRAGAAPGARSIAWSGSTRRCSKANLAPIYLARMDRALGRVTSRQVLQAAEELLRITGP